MLSDQVQRFYKKRKRKRRPRINAKNYKEDMKSNMDPNDLFNQPTVSNAGLMSVSALLTAPDLTVT